MRLDLIFFQLSKIIFFHFSLWKDILSIFISSRILYNSCKPFLLIRNCEPTCKIPYFAKYWTNIFLHRQLALFLHSIFFVFNLFMPLCKVSLEFPVPRDLKTVILWGYHSIFSTNQRCSLDQKHLGSSSLIYIKSVTQSKINDNKRGKWKCHPFSATSHLNSW